MKVEPKIWDSEFFKLKIGFAGIYTLDDAIDLKRQYDSLRRQYDLIYVFDYYNVGFEAEGASLVDEKVLYGKRCEPQIMYDEVCMYTDQPFEDLYRLALTSGYYSRYRLDNRFPQGSFERMYMRWVENACSMQASERMYVLWNQSKKAKGMATLNINQSIGHIGLIAVGSEYQHQGIGTKIISTLEGILYKAGVEKIEVPTQKANVDACRWYENRGYAPISVIPIYHWWLNNK